MEGITVYGAPWCPDCRRSKAFLAEQGVPYAWVDVDQDPTGLAVIERLQGGGRTIPTVVFPDGSHLLEPTNAELAAKLSLHRATARRSYDLLVVGGGPAGLSAAMYGARESLATLVLERSAFGGQVVTTGRVANYPAFPRGVSGVALAERLASHARRAGATLLGAVGVESLTRLDDDQILLRTDNGVEYKGSAVIVATGTHHRRLGVIGEQELIGTRVHFCASCDGPFYRGAAELLVVGGGNSALEESLTLVRYAKRVRIVARTGLRASAAVEAAVRRHPRIVVHANTDIRALEGGVAHLTAVRAYDRAAGEDLRFTPDGVFEFVGLEPNTAFLRGSLELDAAGFIVTDAAYQTLMPGVFAAGDVRASATRQIGAATGEGIGALLAAHRRLADARRLGGLFQVATDRAAAAA